jgi:hypothetical protein
MFVKLGGGKINRKLFISVLLFFGLALFLNVSSSSAASVNQTNTSISATSLDHTNSDTISSNYTTDNSNSNINNDTSNVTVNSVSNPINSTMAAGAPVKVNGLTLAQLKSGTARVQSYFNKNGRLPKYVSFGTRKIPIATFKKNIAKVGLKLNTIKVNGLTVYQIKVGISKVQLFYSRYGRFPNFVSFGTRQIPIATFKSNVATLGLIIKTTSSNSLGLIDTSSVAALAKSLTAGSTSTYDSAMNIFNWVRDNIGYSFYYNTKYGAAGTLAHMTGNCCDTANLLVALARDAGITARYVHGNCQFNSGTWYGHVWAQLYVNGKWYTADATSYSNSLGVIKNWNTATYTLNGIYTTLPF